MRTQKKTSPWMTSSVSDSNLNCEEFRAIISKGTIDDSLTSSLLQELSLHTMNVPCLLPPHTHTDDDSSESMKEKMAFSSFLANAEYHEDQMLETTDDSTVEDNELYETDSRSVVSSGSQPCLPCSCPYCRDKVENILRDQPVLHIRNDPRKKTFSISRPPEFGWLASIFCPPTSERATSVFSSFSVDALKETTYTICQVQRHNHKDSAWIVAGVYIYDVTSYLSNHPGGTNSLLSRAGGVRDCTRDLNFHSKQGQKVWEQYKIGRLVECPACTPEQRRMIQRHESRPWWCK